MKIHYYLGWFNNHFSEPLINMLTNDIVDRKSLVLISADPYHYEDEEVGSIELSWFHHAGLNFEEYHIIDFDISKEDAEQYIKDASVVFLLGGYAKEQNELLVKYKLIDLIREKDIVLGTSAGSINMSKKWLYSEYTGNSTKESQIIDGLGLDEFSVLSHYDLENTLNRIQYDLHSLLTSMDVYASNKDCALRVKNNEIDIIGDVYLISLQSIIKLSETI
ncbi:MAG: Type 1 glutamine amidotransferase-like domain-containing protein [Anaerorhabdus sp.]|uniref:Type 1 glutamine amidotransferase-like domain-containing protein n=1 Tax=Anaerorhabdus sp. TaxID=1872524 RepID=UPI002FCA1816